MLSLCINYTTIGWVAESSAGEAMALITAQPPAWPLSHASSLPVATNVPDAFSKCVLSEFLNTLH